MNLTRVRQTDRARLRPNMDTILQTSVTETDNPQDDDSRLTSWYENRDEKVTGTWAEYEARVRGKIAAHVAQTALMRDNITSSK